MKITMNKDEFKTMYFDRMNFYWKDTQSIIKEYGILLNDGKYADCGMSITVENNVKTIDVKQVKV
jgi:hypothetical protein